MKSIGGYKHIFNTLFFHVFFFQEHSFEVSVFAELFNEMLMRDFGFNIYRAIVEAPEKPKEEKEKPKDEKEKEKPKEEKEKEKTKDEKEKIKEEKEKTKDEKEKTKDDKEKLKEEDKDTKVCQTSTFDKDSHKVT